MGKKTQKKAAENMKRNKKDADAFLKRAYDSTYKKLSKIYNKQG